MREPDLDGQDLGVWDCVVRSFDGSRLEVAGGADSSVWERPSVVLRFVDVSYIECPTAFSHPRLRLASPEEQRALARREAIDAGSKAYVFEAESAGSLEPQRFYIVAERLEIEWLT